MDSCEEIKQCNKRKAETLAAIEDETDFERKRKEGFFNSFDREHARAKREYRQLVGLWRDVCWYNFETNCRKWTDPWHSSMYGSWIELHGHSFCTKWQNGRLVESGTFPVWYSGVLGEAPHLPPEILLDEIDEAKKYVEFTAEQRWAPYDYAPGGRKYQQLLREGDGVRAYNALRESSNAP